MKKLILLFASLGLLISCSDDNEAPGHEIHGVWTVTQIIGEMDTVPVIEDGDIVWAIDIDNKKLKIKSKDPIMESGTYDITVSNGLFTIHRVDLDTELKYSFQDGLLVIQVADDDIMDAPIIKLKKFQIVLD